MNKQLISLSLAAFLLAGCASAPNEIAAQSVSHLQYRELTCKQLIQELDRVNTKATQLEVSLEKTASNDSAQMAVGMVLFWPALFFLEGGDGPQAAEYAKIKGERDAIEKRLLIQECD